MDGKTYTAMEEIYMVKVKKLNPLATIPTQGTLYSAGLDLYSLSEHFCKWNETEKIHTGIAVEIPIGYVGLIFARSGLATKHGLRPANCVGVIDSDYRGEIIVALHNDSLNDTIIEEGERVAQLVIVPYLYPNLVEVDELSETERGTGGFGSTGK